jgi:cytochrome c oxidase cbb3-type subunit I/II
MVSTVLDTTTTAAKIRAMQTLGVPYPTGYDKIANSDLHKQANQIAKGLTDQSSEAVLADAGVDNVSDKEIIALIAYLQRLGTDIKAKKE